MSRDAHTYLIRIVDQLGFIQMVGIECGVNNKETWIHPALYQEVLVV